MPPIHEPLYPASADSADSYAMLALAVVVQTVHDLQAGPSPRRASARLAVAEGSLAGWLDLLSLDSSARGRVETLLWELAR